MLTTLILAARLPDALSPDIRLIPRKAVDGSAYRSSLPQESQLFLRGESICGIQSSQADTNRRLVHLACAIAHVALSMVSDGSG